MKKIKKNQVIITALALMIAVAGYINYAGNLKNIISVSKNEETIESFEDPGTVILTSSDGVSQQNVSVSTNVVSAAKLSREQVRSQNKEMLLEIVNNESIDTAAKQGAIDKITQISDNAERETAAELLLEAKGFNDAVVSMVDGSVDVVINCTELTDSQRAQVEDIVKRKTGVTADKITINICNN